MKLLSSIFIILYAWALNIPKDAVLDYTTESVGSTHTLCERKPFLGGNWKCYGDVSAIDNLIKSLNESKLPSDVVEIVVAPSQVHLDRTRKNLRHDISVSSQNIATFDSHGAYTGETLAKDVAGLGGTWVIVGHSERRGLGESNEDVRMKVRNALKEELGVIVCVGETLYERESHLTEEVLEDQLSSLLYELRSSPQWRNIVIAYEPRWAIGTGKAAEPEDIRRVHAFIRQITREIMGKQIANEIRIVYGGSVNGKNAEALANIEGVDGFLVGKAATDPEDFKKIARSMRSRF